MSQLYQLFCEGLKPRKGKEELSSTLMFTSTPLEDEDCDCVAKQNKPSRQDGSRKTVGTAGAAVGSKQSPNLSVEGQVGSASPAEGSRGSHSRSPTEKQASQVGLNEPLQSSPSPARQGRGSLMQAQSNPSGTPTRNCQSPQLVRERDKTVSPVDFVDIVIATKRRDNALGLNQNEKARTAKINDPVLNTSQNNLPADHLKRKSSESSDSSCTDFEGAAEYYRKYPRIHDTVQSKSTEFRSPAKKVRSSANSQKSSDESLNLVLSSSSVSSASSEDEGTYDIVSPSAARCRVYPKIQNRKSKSPECSPIIVEVSRDASTQGSQRNVQPCLTHAQRSDMNLLLNHKKGSPGELVTSQSACVLKGIVAYVEVRSGHDNRSMGVRNHLRKLGATVVEKFTKRVTHVIFNEGAPSTLRRAQKEGCHLVSVLWIEESEKLGCIAAEVEHPPLNMHIYAQQNYRKMKSLQPDFEEEKGNERLNNYIKKFRRKAQKAILSAETDNKSLSSSDEYEQGLQAEKLNHQQVNGVKTHGIILKELSVVLNRIDAVDTSTASVFRKNTKRKLMPLGLLPPPSISLQDFDPKEPLKPKCPYYMNEAPRQKSSGTQRTVVKSPPALVNLRRRSSCFARSIKHPTQTRFQQKKSKTEMRTMVCTFMHRRDIDVVAAVIKNLGGWIMEPTVSARTTHVVCGDSKRTINLLRGLAHGCWILHQEWVMRSLEAGHWLDEEPFELTEFPAAQQCRIARETLGVTSNIFSTTDAIYVAKDTTPPRSDLLELLKLCGAHIVSGLRLAKIIIGHCESRASRSEVVYVNEQWVLDSIQENMLQPLRRYYLNLEI